MSSKLFFTQTNFSDLCHTSTVSFGDVWPLDDAQKCNLIKCGTALVSRMKIHKLYMRCRTEEKSVGTFGEAEGGGDVRIRSRHAPQPKDTDDVPWEEFDLSDDDIHLETTPDEFDLHSGAPGSSRDRQNLIDILYNEGCISLLHKQHIEQQPTQQLQNLEMLHLIKNGSIKTFKVALEYFRGTQQDKVFDMLNRKYLSEGDQILPILITSKFVSTIRSKNYLCRFLRPNLFHVEYTIIHSRLFIRYPATIHIQ